MPISMFVEFGSEFSSFFFKHCGRVAASVEWHALEACIFGSDTFRHKNGAFPKTSLTRCGASQLRSRSMPSHHLIFSHEYFESHVFLFSFTFARMLAVFDTEAHPLEQPNGSICIYVILSEPVLARLLRGREL